MFDDFGSSHLRRLRKNRSLTVHNDTHSLLHVILRGEKHFHKEIDRVFANVASNQNHVGRKRHDLLYDDLDVSSIGSIHHTYSTSCESNVDSDAYWYLFL